MNRIPDQPGCVSPDNVYIEGLKVSAKVGVYGWEKKVEQPLFIDIELALDLAPAGQSDHLADTLDYAALAEQIQQLALAQHYQLIEHFAEIVAQQLLIDTRVMRVKIKIHKPCALANAVKVGVQLTRSR